MKLLRVARLAPLLLCVYSAATVAALNGRWPGNWTIAPLSGESVFTIAPVGDGDSAHLHVENERNIGQLFMNTRIPVNADTTLKWRWNVRNLPSDVAENRPDTHQYYAVAVRFDNDQILSYIWSSELPVGSTFDCPLPAWKDRETHIVMHSGSRDFSQWIAEERDLMADYARYKNKEPPAAIVQIWVIAAAVKGDGEMTLADISVSDGSSAHAFLSGRGFSARDLDIAAIHATLPGTWSGRASRMDAATGETVDSEMTVGYASASTDALDYAYQGPFGISLASYLGGGSFEIRQFSYETRPSTVAYQIQKIVPPDARGNWTVHELVTMTQANRAAVQWRQVWSLKDGVLRLDRERDPVSGEAPSAQRFLGYVLRRTGEGERRN